MSGKVKKTKVIDTLDVAKKIASFADGIKAVDIVLLDMREVVNYCDYSVVCSADGGRHVKAVADGIDEQLSVLGIKIKFKHGLSSAGRGGSFSLRKQSKSVDDSSESVGHWALLDLGGIVVHIFEPGARNFYGLERLWQGAIKLDW